MDIIGHKKILDLLNKSIVRGTIAQAYLFSGPEHLGKFTVALNFAQRLAGGNAEINPDLIIIKPGEEPASIRSPRFDNRVEAGGYRSSTRGGGKKGIIKKSDIKIEQIRELGHKLSLMAASGKYKVAIIDDADRLNKASQNALLKTLEEPNDRIVLILISKDNKKLLATLKSRCQRIKFEPVSREVLEENIPAGGKNREELIFWSLGRPGLMLELMQDKNALDFRVQAVSELKMIINKNLAEKFSIADAMGKDTQEAIQKMNLWAIILRENLLGRSALGQSQQKCFAIIENIGKSLELVKETNSSTRLILENLFLHF